MSSFEGDSVLMVVDLEANGLVPERAQGTMAHRREKYQRFFVNSKQSRSRIFQQKLLFDINFCLVVYQNGARTRKHSLLRTLQIG